MMASRLTAALALTLAMTLFSTSRAATLQVQFEQNVAGVADQAGWTVVAAAAPPLAGVINSGEFNGLSFSANSGFVRSNPTANYLAVNHSDGDLDNLLRGGVLTNTANTDVTLTLSGLADGDYTITTYHHTPFTNTDGLNFDLLLTDSAVTNSLIHDDVPISFGLNVTTAELASLVTPFTVSNGDIVTLVFDGEASGFATNGGDHLNLNGFELSAVAAVPEPASLAIWSLIGLGLVSFGYCRARRKS